MGTSPFHQNPESVLSSSRRIPLRPPFSSSEGRSKLCVSGKSPSTIHPPLLHPIFWWRASQEETEKCHPTPPLQPARPPTKWGSIINQGRKFDEQRIRRQVKKLLKYERTPSTEWAAFFQTWKKILFRNGKLIYNFFIFWRTSQKRHCNFLSIVWLSSILSLGSWDREFWKIISWSKWVGAPDQDLAMIEELADLWLYFPRSEFCTRAILHQPIRIGTPREPFFAEYIKCIKCVTFLETLNAENQMKPRLCGEDCTSITQAMFSKSVTA